MKNFIALAALLMVTYVSVAQDATTEPLKSKKGILLLPQTGEWGLGVAANPFLNYLGDFMNSTVTNSSAGFDYASNPFGNIALFGKYVKNSNTYYRGRLNINVQTDINKVVINADQLIPPPAGFPSFTEDWQKTGSQTILLAGGLEKRRGSTRLQGLYGAELLLGYSGGKVAYEYGNPISAANQTPTNHNFGNNISNNGDRVTEEKTGKSVLIGARGFIGIEYFIAPRISIGGEFGYSITATSTGKTVVTSEAWNNGSNSVLSTKTDVYQGGFPTTQFRAGIDNLDGGINLLFYF